MTTPEEIIVGLENATKTYNRDPTSGIYPLYLQFLETGDYPYTRTVVMWILQRVEGIPPYLHRQLETEVYLAARQNNKEIEAKQREQLLENGFTQATKETVAEGKRYLLSNIPQTKQQQVKCILHEGTLYLMPVRNRTKGFHIQEQWIKEVPPKTHS